MIEKFRSKIVDGDFIVSEHFNEKLGIRFYQLENKSTSNYIK